MQLIERGVDLLAVEPDARMAASRGSKGDPRRTRDVRGLGSGGPPVRPGGVRRVVPLGGSGCGPAEDSRDPRRRRKAGADLEPVTPHQPDPRRFEAIYSGLHGRRNPQGRRQSRRGRRHDRRHGIHRDPAATTRTTCTTPHSSGSTSRSRSPTSCWSPPTKRTELRARLIERIGSGRRFGGWRRRGDFRHPGLSLDGRIVPVSFSPNSKTLPAIS